jgi:DnaJ-class molecular chaperone
VDLGDLFGGAFGGGRGGAAGGRTRPRQGEDLTLEITVPFQVAAEGGDHELTLQREGKPERITIKIPPGVDEGGVIRLAGQGQPGANGGAAGDLLITVHIAPHPWFRRDGADLLLDLPLTITEAALGAKVDVPTLSEGTVTLTIPAGTSSGSKMRLRGKGVLDRRTKERGHLYAIVKIVVPQNLTAEAQVLLRKLAEEAPQSPRAGLW